MTMKNKTMIYLFLTYLSLASVFAGESGSLRVFAPPPSSVKFHYSV